MAALDVTGDLVVTGSITFGANFTGTINGAQSLLTTPDQTVDIPLNNWRVWDALQTNLPAVGAVDDLGFASGSFGTTLGYLTTQDLNAAGAVTQRARLSLGFPEGFVTGSDFKLAFYAGMLTSVASVSATVDVEAYLQLPFSRAVDGADVVLEAAKSINSLTGSLYTFTCTGAAASSGRFLDVRVTIAANSITASSHFAAIFRTFFIIPIKY